MKSPLQKGLIIYGAVFALLLSFRLLYGWVTFGDETHARTANVFAGYANQQAADGLTSFKNNIASDTRMVKKEAGGTAAPRTVAVEQKYEKVAQIKSISGNFDSESKKIKTVIIDNHAVIQFERNTGLKGERALELAIGVLPESFDSMVDQVRAIGRITSISIDKIDKTSEYKDLSAKRQSLEQTITALSAIKGRGGSVDEYISLENKILETKNAIQGLGVRLGDYAEENELCTIKFSLNERSEAHYSFIRSLRISLVWSVQLYFAVTVCMFIFIATLHVGLKMSDRLGLTAKILAFINSLRARK